MLIQLKPKHRPTAMYEQRIRDALATTVSAGDRLFPGRRYHQPGAELRPAGGDRRADNRQQPAGRLRYRAAAEGADGADSGSGRPAHRRAARLPEPSRSRSIAPRRSSSASREQQVASSLLTSLTGAQLSAAELLARSGKRRQLQRHRAGAAASVRLGQRAAEYPAQHDRNFVERRNQRFRPPAPAGPQRTRSRSCSATSRRSATAGIPRSWRTTPCSASSTSIARCRAATSARSPRRCSREIGRLGKLPPGTQVVIRGQSQAMQHVVRHARRRPGARDHPRLPADGRQLPVVARAVHHHDGGAGRARGRAVDAGADAARRSTSSR